jgi:hypothetical protein
MPACSHQQQEAHIQKTICDKRPEQLKMDFFLWSRAAVMQLIEQECGLKLGVRTVGKYLTRWGFTPQKPIKKAYEQRPEAVKVWLDEHYPAIEAKARQRVAKFTGAMKPHWSTPMCAAGAMHRRVKHPWLTRWAVHVRSFP